MMENVLYDLGYEKFVLFYGNDSTTKTGPDD